MRPIAFPGLEEGQDTGSRPLRMVHDAGAGIENHLAAIVGEDLRQDAWLHPGRRHRGHAARTQGIANGGFLGGWEGQTAIVRGVEDRIGTGMGHQGAQGQGVGQAMLRRRRKGPGEGRVGEDRHSDFGVASQGLEDRIAIGQDIEQQGIGALGDELAGEVLSVTDFGGRIVRFVFDGVFEEILDRLGETPLPPYIRETLADKERYQTVYANENGSAAAPTAGLHFTTELLDDIRKKGVTIVDVLLHVGLGTFRPVSEDNVEDHHMHSEYCECSEEAARTINEARAAGGRVFAVGTTSCRTLESVTDDEGIVHAKKGWTDIFITPGYKFKAVDKLITNFHLPESTLLMLVSALCTREEMLDVYKHAVEEKYRFFSFGDAMLIL